MMHKRLTREISSPRGKGKNYFLLHARERYLTEGGKSLKSTQLLLRLQSKLHFILVYLMLGAPVSSDVELNDVINCRNSAGVIQAGPAGKKVFMRRL